MSDAGMEMVVEKIRKLLNLASKNTSEAEAASAAAKAQELLASYNLDMATIEQGGGATSGKREEQRSMGGMYLYERELWRAIAELNFCMYFTTRELSKVKGRKISFNHRIIGRTVNTQSTLSMTRYLQSTVERICRDRFPVNSQFFSREAVSFREGISDRLTTRLERRRRENAREEDRKKAAQAMAAKRDGADTKFALTLVDVKNSEEIANYNFLHGEGTYEKRQAVYEKWDKEAAEERARKAAAEAEADALYAKWAAANPEEAAAEEKKRVAKEKAKARAKERSGGGFGRYRAPTPADLRRNSSYFRDGQDRGDGISLEPQMEARETKRIG